MLMTNTSKEVLQIKDMSYNTYFELLQEDDFIHIYDILDHDYILNKNDGCCEVYNVVCTDRPTMSESSINSRKTVNNKRTFGPGGKYVFLYSARQGQSL